MKRLINSEYHDEIKIDELKGNFNRMSIEINKKEKLQQLEQEANLSTYPSKRFNSFCYDDDDDEDYAIAITPSLSTKEPDNSLISSIDDDSFSIYKIDYVEASPPDSELVSSEVMEIVISESSSTSFNSFLEETNTFHNSLPEFENFYFDLGKISSGSTTTHSDLSLPEYDSFIFDLTHEEFVDELAHIISPSEYDCFYF
nr:hypothetical protein [Tanacetum cinerariifolium]